MRITFSARLFAYLVERRRSGRVARFTVGEWLETLDEGDLNIICDLESRVQTALLDPTDRALFSDLKKVCELALAAELRRPQVQAHDQTVNELIVLASLQGLHKKGLIQVTGKLSIAPNARAPTVTIQQPPSTT